jgi:RES domain-containing protein
VTGPPRPGHTVTLYRAVYEDFVDDPVPSHSGAGRFHDDSTTGATTYLAATPETAWKEITHRWAGDRARYRMVEVSVTIRNVVDLTDRATRRRYGIDEESLTADHYGACQRLRKRLEAEGVEAIWTYSRADRPGGRQLVVLLARLQEGSSVEVIRTGPITV